jgi:hypothetical protein
VSFIGQDEICTIRFLENRFFLPSHLKENSSAGKCGGLLMQRERREHC